LEFIAGESRRLRPGHPGGVSVEILADAAPGVNRRLRPRGNSTFRGARCCGRRV